MAQATTRGLPAILLVLAFVIACSAQLNQPNAEGKIISLTSVCEACDATCGTQPCGEIQIFAPSLKCTIVPSTVITVTMMDITFKQLVSTTPFPGNGHIGFRNGTAFFFADEQVNPDGTLENICTAIFVLSVANEDILTGLGTIINPTTGLAVVQGIVSRPIKDPENRLVTVYQSEEGFNVDPATIPALTAGVTLTGYFEPLLNTLFYYIFTVPAGTGTLIPGQPFLAIAFAQCRVLNFDLRIVGGIRAPFNTLTTQVQVVMAPGGKVDKALTLPAQNIRVLRGVGANFGRIIYRVRPIPTACPSHVQINILGASGPGTSILVPLVLR